MEIAEEEGECSKSCESLTNSLLEKAQDSEDFDLFASDNTSKGIFSMRIKNYGAFLTLDRIDEETSALEKSLYAEKILSSGPDSAIFRSPDLCKSSGSMHIKEVSFNHFHKKSVSCFCVKGEPIKFSANRALKTDTSFSIQPIFLPWNLEEAVPAFPEETEKTGAYSHAQLLKNVQNNLERNLSAKDSSLPSKKLVQEAKIFTKNKNPERLVLVEEKAASGNRDPDQDPAFEAKNQGTPTELFARAQVKKNPSKVKKKALDGYLTPQLSFLSDKINSTSKLAKSYEKSAAQSPVPASKGSFVGSSSSFLSKKLSHIHRKLLRRAFSPMNSPKPVRSASMYKVVSSVTHEQKIEKARAHPQPGVIDSGEEKFNFDKRWSSPSNSFHLSSHFTKELRRSKTHNYKQLSFFHQKSSFTPFEAYEANYNVYNYSDSGNNRSWQPESIKLEEKKSAEERKSPTYHDLNINYKESPDALFEFMQSKLTSKELADQKKKQGNKFSRPKSNFTPFETIRSSKEVISEEKPQKVMKNVSCFNPKQMNVNQDRALLPYHLTLYKDSSQKVMKCNQVRFERQNFKLATNSACGKLMGSGFAAPPLLSKVTTKNKLEIKNPAKVFQNIYASLNRISEEYCRTALWGNCSHQLMDKALPSRSRELDFNCKKLSKTLSAEQHLAKPRQYALVKAKEVKNYSIAKSKTQPEIFLASSTPNSNQGSARARLARSPCRENCKKGSPLNFGSYKVNVEIEGVEIHMKKVKSTFTVTPSNIEQLMRFNTTLKNLA